MALRQKKQLKQPAFLVELKATPDRDTSSPAPTGPLAASDDAEEEDAVLFNGQVCTAFQAKEKETEEDSKDESSNAESKLGEGSTALTRSRLSYVPLKAACDKESCSGQVRMLSALGICQVTA